MHTHETVQLTNGATLHATRCDAYGTHRPSPSRFVVHHVLPQVCGGKSTPENTTQLCDNCHYGTHGLLWLLAQGRPLPKGAHRGQVALARRGYDAAVAAGTVSAIPNEGAVTA